MVVIPLADQQEALDALHAKAWNKPWPAYEHTLCRSELGGLEQSSPKAVAADWDADWSNEYTAVPDSFEYECLLDIHEVTAALDASSTLNSNLVVLKEYEVLLRELTTGAFKGERQSVALAGHPGIG